MAIYSLNLGFISRSEGRSAVGFSAYISASQQVDERTGVRYDFVCKSDVIVSRILAPEDAPEWAKTSSTLWNKAEQFEDEWGTLRFRGNTRDAEKNQKSLEAREQFLSSAQTAQTIMGAIPIEFSKLEAEACVEEFLQTRFVPRGLVVEYAIHWERGNPHFHGQITRRALVEGEFSQRKDRDIVSKPELLITRKEWEKVVNKHLELGGHEVRIDCRSHEDRGSLLLPTHHEGWYAQRLAEQGQYSRIVADNEAVRQKNIKILCNNPEALIQEVALKRTTFTRRHIEEEIIRRVGGDAKLFALLKARVEEVDIPSELILKCANQNIDYKGLYGDGSHRDIVYEGGELRGLATKLTDRLLGNQDIAAEVGENLNRDIVFTSTAYKKQEENLVQLADTLHQRSTKVVSESIITKALAYGEEQLGNSFSTEQREAVHHLCSGPELRILNGKAGTGKTTLLKAVAHAYQQAGYEVIGTTFQGKAVDIMEEDIGISCRSLDSFICAWDKHQEQKDLVESGKLWGRPYIYAFNKMKDLEKHRFTSNMVILVDEANMIGGRLWEPFLTEAASCGVKVLVIQDPAQIKSREPGDYGRLFAERFGFCETTEVVRQRVPWQRECSKLLNEHKVLDGLKPYYDKGNFQWFEDKQGVHKALAQDYVKDLMANPHQTRIALAYQNTEVYELNQVIRAVLIEKGCLGRSRKQNHLQHRLLQESLPQECPPQEFKIQGETYAIGDRIRFTQNDNYGQHIRNVDEQPFFLSSLMLGGGDLRQTKDLNSATQKSFKKGVKNGSFGTIEAFDEKQSLLTVVLDDKRRIQFDIHKYSHLTLGYAMGIHKSEASTFDKGFLSFDPLMDPSTTLVSMTRHREDVTAYVNREQFIDFKQVVEKISPVSSKETLQDYRISEEQKPYFARVQQYRDLLIEGMTLREELEGAIDDEIERTKEGTTRGSKTKEERREGEKDPQTTLYQHPAYQAYQVCFEERKRIAEEILADWQNHAPYTRLAGIRKDVLEVESGLRPRLLSDLEYRASLQVQGYMDLVKETRDLWKTISQTHPGSLAKSHNLYEDYTVKKMDRDSLAFVFQENPKLYRPFLRVTEDAEGTLRDYWGEVINKEDRVYISALKSHAEAHIRSQLQNLYYERLSPDQKIHYDEVKSYVNVRNEAASLYSHLQKQDEATIQVTSPESVLSLEKFHELQAERDRLALKIVDSPEKYQDFFDVFNIKENKLLEHAVAGEIREKVHAYKTQTNIEKRSLQAQELKRILNTSKDYRIFKESGLDTNRLTFDIAFYDKVKSGEISPTLQPEDVYKPIQAYLDSSKQAAQLWKIIHVKGKGNYLPEKRLNENHSPIDNREALKSDWQLALTARNENARTLVSQEPSLVVIAEMRQGIGERIYRQAGFIQRDVKNPSSQKTTMDSSSHNRTSSPPIIQKSHQQPFISIEQVRAAAKGNMNSLATDLLGIPNKHMSSKTSLRFGTRGSMVVNIAGLKAGQWKDFESGQGGDIISLVQREKNLNLKETVTYLADVLNVRSHKEPSLYKPSSHIQPQLKPQDSLAQIKENAMRLNAVSELNLKSKPIEGTLAQSYLQQERHIKGPLPPDLRYIPKGTTFMYQGERRTLQHNSLAVFGRNQEGRLSSVQLTKLDHQGKRALNIDGTKLNKIHYGIAKGSFVLLQEDKSNNAPNPVFIAEGVETALSIRQAGVKGTIVASMGIHNITNYQGSQKGHPSNESSLNGSPFKGNIIICADNDDHKPNSQTYKTIESTKNHFESQGKSVSIIKPNSPGDDFNDVLKKQGISGVQEYVKPYLDPDRQPLQGLDVYKGPSLEAPLTATPKAPAQEAQLSLKEETLNSTSPSTLKASPSSPTSSTNTVTKPEPKPIEIISDYVGSLLRKVKHFEGYSLGEEAKQELKTYLKLLQKNEITLPTMKAHNPELAQEAQDFMQRHMRDKSKGMER